MEALAFGDDLMLEASAFGDDLMNISHSGNTGVIIVKYWQFGDPQCPHLQLVDKNGVASCEDANRS